MIHSANPPDYFFLIGGFFKLFGKRFVFDHHDLVPESCETRWSGPKLAIIRQMSLWAERATFRVADRVIAVNESYRAIAQDRGNVPANRICVVRSAPRLTGFRPVTPRPELRNGRGFLVGYLGVMGPNDGLEHLLRAIDHIVHHDRQTDTQFVLIGGGDLQPALAEMGRSMGLADYVRFTGRIPDDEVIALLSTADLCVAPDPKDPLNDVSTMNKVVEYMALGKAIVAFDLSETRVSAGRAADYVTPNDPVEFAHRITSLLADPARLREMGAWGQEHFRAALAWEHQEASLLDLYRELIGVPISSAPG